ncbi:MAG: putative selenate reductase subunit YgfK, partial [Bacteroidota bacterium]
ELTLAQSYEEYLKAWFALHLLNDVFHFSPLGKGAFVFNMSVGYTLDGIKTERMNAFIDALKDSSTHSLFRAYKSIIKDQSMAGVLSHFIESDDARKQCVQKIEDISPFVAGSVTLSTMHGCPSDEIEEIAKYFIREKGLHTYVKLNPTLLGYDAVNDILQSLGYRYISLEREAFMHDLQFTDAVQMVKRLKDFSAVHKKTFGIKLSNTLGVRNTKHTLAGDQMYMSGRSLFPVTINLAHKLAETFDGSLNISFSGGVTINNVEKIFDAGLSPITLVTDLLKPGGYSRLFQMAEKLENNMVRRGNFTGTIDLTKLKALAEGCLTDEGYRKSKREIESVKVSMKLEKFDCYIAPCAVACPIHQDVGEYIRLVEEERYADAFEVIVDKNPLPHITGYICDHQCMNKCTRWDYDGPVQIRDLKKVAAERGFEEYLQRFKNNSSHPKNHIPVAIVGAGPSGLAAGYFLAKSGFDITIFEQRDRAGGTVQHVIPEFRLPQSAIDDDVEFIKRHGVKFEFDSMKDFSVRQLKADGFKYIYLAIGAPKPNHLPLTGNNKNIIDGVDFLKQFRDNAPIQLAKKVAVVGGGNSAMDAARGALRIRGVEKLYLIYRRTKEFMPADKEEFDAALREGAIFRELLLPIDFTGNALTCQKMQLAESGPDGRRRVIPIENEFETIETDSVISAIGENVDTANLRQNAIPYDERKRVNVVRETNETMVENVYIGGDALRGPSTVVESIADGKKAAEAIIQKEHLESVETLKLNSFFQTDNRMKDLLIARGNVITKSTNTGQNFLSTKEASRCLGCSFVCDKCVEVCPNRANVALRIGEFKNIAQILHLDALCNECGDCETFCPYTVGSPYKNKTTLFWNEKELLESSNDGFYLDTRNLPQNHFTAMVRFNGETGTMVCDSKGTLLRCSLQGSHTSPELATFARIIANVVTEHSYLLAPAIH